MLALSRADVAELLDLPALVDAVAAAMVDLSTGAASAPPRVAAEVPDRGLLAAVPAHLPSAGALTTKLVSLFPGNRDRPTHQAVICCFDPADGTPLAVLDGTHITAMRTAAGSSVATRLLARPDSRVVAVIGTGVQARAHLALFAALSQAERYVVAGRDAGEADALARSVAADLGIRVEARASVRDAIAEADVVCATTHADVPVVTRDMLAEGTHVNSVGYNSAGQGEVDAATVRDAVVVVESRSSALAPPPAGAVELRRAIDSGVVGPDVVHAELGELITGTRTGRTGPADITLYKSVGVAVQDAAAAALVLAAARARGIGAQVDV
jgi:ornithine cyclodeaminase